LNNTKCDDPTGPVGSLRPPDPDDPEDPDSSGATDQGDLPDPRWAIEFNLDDCHSEALEPLGLATIAWRQLQAAIQATLLRHGRRRAEISVAVVRGVTMQRLNRQYLGHDYDTDVLSFCLEEESADRPLLGQLIVSLDFAARQASRLSGRGQGVVTLRDELALYLVHGTLHLLGFDDQDPEDRRAMRRQEAEVLEGFGIFPVWLDQPDGRPPGLSDREEPG